MNLPLKKMQQICSIGLFKSVQRYFLSTLGLSRGIVIYERVGHWSCGIQDLLFDSFDERNCATSLPDAE